MPERDPRERLVEDGLLEREESRLRTTARAQGALARAALSLQRAGAPWKDLRLPLAAALAERYPDLPDQELADLVEAMLPIVMAELPPMFGEAAER
jgi:hypothetical protein